MFCPNCGTPNPDSATQCGSCGTYIQTGGPAGAPPAGAAPVVAGNPYPAQGAMPAGSVPNHLVLSILGILCFWPVGIVAIINATKVNSKLQAGDYVGARRASRNAKTWSIVALVIGLVGVAAQIILTFFLEHMR